MGKASRRKWEHRKNKTKKSPREEIERFMRGCTEPLPDPQTHACTSCGTVGEWQVDRMPVSDFERECEQQLAQRK